MSATLIMPRLSDTMEEGTIVRWLEDDGAQIAVGQAVAEVETDKATVELEAVAAGVLQIVASAGTTVPVGGTVGFVGTDDAHVPPPDRASREPDQGATPVAVARAPRARRTANASPLARRVAEDLQLDLDSIVGSGPRGRIVRRDVEKARDAGVSAATNGQAGAQTGGAAMPSSAETGPAAMPTLAKGEPVVRTQERVEHVVARRMAESRATVPDFDLEVDVAMDAVMAFRDQIKAEVDAQVPSLNDIVMKAVALALRDHPDVNASYRDGEVLEYPRVNVGFAVAIDKALYVPTVLDADRISLGALAEKTRELVARARDGALTAADLAGGTFTVSNLGMFGVDRFTAVLNPPQAAILAVGRLRPTPILSGERWIVGHAMTLRLACDHRAINGAAAAAFLAAITSRLASPLSLVV